MDMQAVQSHVVICRKTALGKEICCSLPCGWYTDQLVLQKLQLAHLAGAKGGGQARDSPGSQGGLRLAGFGDAVQRARALRQQPVRAEVPAGKGALFR